MNLMPRLKVGIFHKLLTLLIVVALVPMNLIWYVNYHSIKKRLTQQEDERLAISLRTALRKLAKKPKDTKQTVGSRASDS